MLFITIKLLDEWLSFNTGKIKDLLFKKKLIFDSHHEVQAMKLFVSQFNS